MTLILAFLGGAVLVTVIVLFWPEDKEVRYLRGVLAALRDTEHDRNNATALEYWEETSWTTSGYGQDEFDRGYRATIHDLQQQLKRGEEFV